MTDATGAPTPESEATDDLSARQRSFVTEYLVDHNGSAAAVRAGYSVLSAKQQASRLLQHPKIKALITQGLEQAAVAAGVKAEDVVARLKAIAWATPNSESWRGPEVLKALELLGKHLRMWQPEVAATVEVEVNHGENALARLRDLVMGRLDRLRPPQSTALVPVDPPAQSEAETSSAAPTPLASEERALPQADQQEADAAPVAPVTAAKAMVVRMRAPQNGSNLFILGDVHLTPDANRLVWVPADRVELASCLGFLEVGQGAMAESIARSRAAGALREAASDEARRANLAADMISRPAV